MTNSSNRFKIWNLRLLFAGVAVSIITWLLLNADHSQTGFKTCYFAAIAHAQGLNPYDLPTLSYLARSQLSVPFVFPPFMLYFFGMFTPLNWHAAALVFTLLKCVLLIVVVVIWTRSFITAGKATAWFFLLLLFGFSSTLVVNLSTGTASLIEQMFLWGAFYYYVNKKSASFCLFVIAAACFNILPVFFLSLLLVGRERYKVVCFFCAVAIFCVLLGISYYSSPVVFGDYLRHGQPFGLIPGQGLLSTTSLIRTGATIFESRTGIVPDAIVLYGIYGALAVTVVLLSVQCISSLTYSFEKYNRVLTVFMACFVYALLNPQLTGTSFMLLLPAAWHVGLNSLRNQRAAIFLLLLISLPLSSPLPGMQVVISYYPLIVAGGLWILFLRDLYHARTVVYGAERFLAAGET